MPTQHDLTFLPARVQLLSLVTVFEGGSYYNYASFFVLIIDIERLDVSEHATDIDVRISRSIQFELQGNGASPHSARRRPLKTKLSEKTD